MNEVNKKRKFSNENGQSMVELAVSFVVLMILLAGVVDLGRMTFYYIAMRDAAQEGASYGAIFPHNHYEIFKRVNAGAVDESRIQITVRFTNLLSEELYVCDNKENIDNCTQFLDSRDLYSNTAKLNDIIEITIRDPNFPITMPLIGAFIGNEIALETTIRDIIVRVPMDPPPTPVPTP